MGFLQNIIDIAAAEAASRPARPVRYEPRREMQGPSTLEFMGERTHVIAGSRFAPLAMAGALRNGNERGGGSVWHAVEIKDGQTVEGVRMAPADSICGKSPSILWSNADHIDVLPAISCPRCLRKLEKIKTHASQTSAAPTAALVRDPRRPCDTHGTAAASPSPSTRTRRRN